LAVLEPRADDLAAFIDRISVGELPARVGGDQVVQVLDLLIVTALSYLAPAPLTEPANTATITYVPRPEWFFFFYEQMLMFFPGYALISFGAVVVPTIFVVLLYALPWLDRQPSHATLRRPFATVVGLLVVVVVVLNMLLAISRIMNFPGGWRGGRARPVYRSRWRMEGARIGDYGRSLRSRVIVNADARGYEEASCAPVWVDVVVG
jgi:quinol---cytochrome c reductase cytochrome c subunit, bacillus type